VAEPGVGRDLTLELPFDAIITGMDAQTIDQEFEKLQSEFQEVAGAVKSLATKLQAAQKAGDANAGEWLGDLENIAKEIDDEQSQTKTLLLAVHGFITDAAKAQPAQPAPSDEKPLFAPGQDPFADSQPQAQPQQAAQPHLGLFGGLFGGMGGGYMGGGFGRAMEMGVGMQLGADLVNNIFR
jgi:hypothetical protein